MSVRSTGSGNAEHRINADRSSLESAAITDAEVTMHDDRHDQGLVSSDEVREGLRDGQIVQPFQVFPQQPSCHIRIALHSSRTQHGRLSVVGIMTRDQKSCAPAGLWCDHRSGYACFIASLHYLHYRHRIRRYSFLVSSLRATSSSRNAHKLSFSIFCRNALASDVI